MLDVAATRIRLREVLPPASAAAHVRYRDSDLDIPNRPPVRPAPPEPYHGDRAFNDAGTPQAVPGVAGSEFIDLDEAPLTMSAGDAAPPVPNEKDVLPPQQSATHAPDAAPAAQLHPAAPPVRLDPPQMRRIIFHATSDPSTAPPFGKTQPNLGGEGLLYGIGRFTQASGDLGRLLTAMREMDAAAFERTFGEAAEELLRVTNAPLPVDEAEAMRPNLAPVDGQPLWSADWMARFKAAARHRAFQDAQYMVAAHTALIPMLDFARGMGLDSEKALAILTERAIQLGVADAKAFVVTAAGPLQTEALKRAALVHLSPDPSTATLSEFQAAKGLPDTAGRLDPDSHAALFAELRASGDSPVPLPSVELMLDQIVAGAVESPMPGRVAAIRENPTLSEARLADADPVME